MKVVLFLIIIFFWLVVGLIEGVKSLLKWRKSGYCNHDWRIYNTLSFGQHHWYKCTKCSEERLR